MPLPDFLFIGPSKSGTTWLFETLRQHPEIFIPPAKDLYFFDRYYARGLDWYSAQFDRAQPNHKAIGEFSHDYLYSPDAAERIAADLPEIRLISILRNPFERAVSHYKFSMRNGAKFQSFSEGLKTNSNILSHSLYARGLSDYLNRFGSEKLYCDRFERLAEDPLPLLSEVFKFLHVDPQFVPATEVRKNRAAAPRNAPMARAVHHTAKAARNIGLTGVIGLAKRSPLTRLIYRDASKEPVRMSESDFQHLQDCFLPDIEAVENLTGLKLGDWKATRLETLNGKPV